MALAGPKDVPELGSGFGQPIADFGGGAIDATAAFHKGALLAFDPVDQTIKPGATATGLIAIGRCESDIAVGEAKTLSARAGIFRFDNSTAGDLIAAADAGTECFIVDDETVAKTNGGSTRSVAGKVYKVDSLGVWVAVNPIK